ncbi:MAG: hypothetical protein QXO15_12125 [Nitrososphaerota archaeon]
MTQNQNIKDIAIITSLIIVIISLLVSHSLIKRDILPLFATIPSDLLYLMAAVISSLIILGSSILAYRKTTERQKIIHGKRLSKDICDFIKDQGFVDIKVLAKRFNIKTNEIIELISENLGKEFYFTKDRKTIISKQYIRKIIIEEIKRIR